MQQGGLESTTELLMTKAEEWADNLNPVISALQRGHYLLYCQQIAALSEDASKRPFNEILVRLFEEERRLLPPGMFFPMLLEQGLMSLLDCWVVSQVLKLQSSALLTRPEWVAPRNSINLSEDSVSDPEFVEFVTTQLDKWKPPTGTIAFEILETIVDGRRDASEALMVALAAKECEFGLGSFMGTAEGFEILTQLPIGFVKIDGSLIRKLLVSPASQQRVAAINDRCHGHGIQTVAEFVEDVETLAVLSDIGVDYVQGFGIAKPAPFLADL
jgi:EAL domain-containing protein (putative c-di-GMP-specific phosphodiesterase class I)